VSPWIWTIIFVFSGLLFAVLELFLPSGGILAFFSLAAFCASVVFAFHQGMEFGLAFLGILMIGLPVLVWQLFMIWPHTPIGRRMLLEPDDDSSLRGGQEKDSLQSFLGKTGVAQSRMMPSGIVLLEGIKYDALSEGEPIDPGTPVVVIQANRLNIVVRACSPPAVSVAPPQRTIEEMPAVPDPFFSR
jgi:membrane-bound serine protease (ClpP class)